MEFPDGISLHRPSPKAVENGGNASETLDTPDHLHNGDVALVFGGNDQVRRFSSVSLQPDMDIPNTRALFPDDIPPIFESYALVPSFEDRPFQGMLQDKRNNRIR